MSIRTWGSLKNGSRPKRANAPRQIIDDAAAHVNIIGAIRAGTTSGATKEAMMLTGGAAPYGTTDTALYIVTNA